MTDEQGVPSAFRLTRRLGETQDPGATRGARHAIRGPARVRRAARLAVLLIAAACTAVGTTLPATAYASSGCPYEAVRAESNVSPVTGEPYSTGLPDCRSYELASSGNKNDTDAMLSPLLTSTHGGTDGLGLVSEGGGRVLWDKEFEPYSAPNDGISDVYESTRGSGGWAQSDALAPPGAGSSLLFIAAASGDLSTVLLQSISNPPEVSVGRTEGLVEHSADGSYTTIVSVPESSSEEGDLHAQLSGDGSHAFFETYAQLASDTHAAGEQVYEWTSAGGLHVVGVDDAGNPVNSCGAVLAGGTRVSYPDVSQDGSRVFFEAPDPLGYEVSGDPACKQPSELYVRENGSTTVEVSKAPPGAAECEHGVTECAATFVGASTDGSKVFFVTRSQLTPDKADTDPDLYEYDVETGALTRLSVGPPGYDDADLAAPTGVTGNPSDWAVVSGDGSHVYFTGLGQLVPGAGASAATDKADGTVNLYVYADRRVSFIATVGPANWPGQSSTHEPPYTAPLAVQVAGVTPDGSDLVFDSVSRLTSYDNAGRGELYRYDAPSATIACVSCSPAFAAPNGPLDPDFHTSFWGAPHGAVQQFGGLSDDGDTVFFASTDELLPAATNVLAAEGSNPIYDIYEWHDGVLSLISSGTSLSSDFLLGASGSGSEVFFLTASQLVSQDGDQAYDVYDARMQGGFPAPVVPVACVSAVACRSMVATPPVAVAPASVSFTGPGDVVPGPESQAPSVTVKAKTESRSEKLAKALKVCGRKPRKERASCEVRARKRYGVRSKAKSSARRGGRS
jgi:hypothetical protein